MSVLNTLIAGAVQHGLMLMGTVHEDQNGQPQSVVLFGTGAGFWPLFTRSSEYQDGASDPLDRWSVRVVGSIAASVQGTAIFPFGGPPYAPFLSWAETTGEAFQSPAGMLVHQRAGMMISFRGAVRVQGQLARPAAAPSPCQNCADQPCKTACPVDALSAERGYNVAACHDYLDTPDGQDCLQNGCKARRACPVSARFGRDPAQSAFHMQRFHPS